MLKDIVTESLEFMLGKSIYVGYELTKQIKIAHEIFETVVGRETIPYVRRAAIDFIVRKNVQTVNNLQAEFRSNKSGNYHHLQLDFENRLIITINHLASINGVRQVMPRPAKFREMLAKSNPLQGNLFPNSNNNYFIDGQKIHSTLIHEGKDFPERVALLVLNSKCNNIIDNLPINVVKHVNKPDVNKIDDLSPEFIEFVKRIAKV